MFKMAFLYSSNGGHEIESCQSSLRRLLSIFRDIDYI